MDKIRSFIAVEVPDEVKSLMAETKACFHPLDPHIRWVKIEGVHLTLKFLGNIERSQIEPISECLREAVAGQRPFEVRAEGAGVFPNMRYPRVLWVGLSEGLDELSSIHDKLEEKLAGLGFEPESRPFNPHLTLGRFRDGRRAGRAISLEMFDKAAQLAESFMVHRVLLMRSQLYPAGAVYTVLKEQMLSN
jgi:2'-5' RNA ligase